MRKRREIVANKIMLIRRRSQSLKRTTRRLLKRKKGMLNVMLKNQRLKFKVLMKKKRTT